MAKAKYDAEELAAMLAKGEAFKNADGEAAFPIGDEEDLKNAIHAVGRAGSDHDAVRKYIIGRAKDLKLTDLIPGNWNADGSLAEEKQAQPGPGWSQRSERTYDDTRQLVTSAVADTLPKDGDGEVWCYISDLTDEWAVYYWQGDYFQVTYSIATDGLVTLGKPVKVAQTTTYTQVPEQKSAGPLKVPAVARRSFLSLVEQPPARVTDIQIRMDEAADPNLATFRGLASATSVTYPVNDWLGEYREQILPGAFAKTLQEQRSIPLLFNHGGMPLASTGSGTSVLSEGREGLVNDATFDRRQALTNDMCIALERRDIDKMSFSFRATKDSWDAAYEERSVSELALYDTSIVTYPANPSTTAELRGAMRSVLGREGISAMFCARTALLESPQARIADAAEPIFESALRALATADEAMCQSYGQHGRARSFVVGALMVQVREGKVLSSANEKLLRDALAALHEADDHLSGIDAALDEGQKALSAVLGVPDPDDDDPDDDGKPAATSTGSAATSTGSGTGSQMMPSDGAGPRSAPPSVLKARREIDLLKLRRP